MGLRHLHRLLFVLAAITLVGCSTTAATSSPTTTTTGQPSTVTFDPNASVVVAVSRLPDEFNPLTAEGSNSVTAMVMASVWPETVVVGDHLPPTTCAGAYPPCDSVVTSAELYSTNPEVVTYQIDPKASWSDGTPITSSDFIYEWQQELINGPSLPAGNPLLGYEDIKSISPPDSKTVTVTFSQPYADWPALFSTLVPAHIAEAGGPDGWVKAFRGFSPTREVSGGPFAITKVLPGKELVLSRNANYWGTPARVAHIVFRVEPSDAATLRGLREGHIDVAELPPGAAVQSLVSASTDLNEQIVDSPLLEQIAFNTADPVVAPVAVREAIAKAIDRGQLLDNTVGLETGFVSVVGNRLYLPGAPGAQGNDGQYQEVDLDEADTLLTQAGYSINAGGTVLTPLGKPLVLTLSGPSGNPLAEGVEEELQAELLQAGIELRIVNVPLEQLLRSVLPEGHYQLALAPYLLSPYLSTAVALYTEPVGLTPPPATGAAGPSEVGPPAPASDAEPASVVSGSVTRDVLGYSDPTVASLFSEAAGELNLTAASSLYNEIDTDLWAALPTIPLFVQPVTVVTRADLVGVSVAETWVGPLWDAQNWAVQVSPPVTTSTTSP